MAKLKKEDKKGLFLIVVALLVFVLLLVGIKMSTSSDDERYDESNGSDKTSAQEKSVSDYFDNATDEELLEDDPFRNKCKDAGATEDNPVFVDGTYCFR